jgi:IS5 family transposase
MNAVIPWARLTALIEAYYPKAGDGRQPMPLERMLRIYFMQQWFNLSDPQAEDALYDMETMRRFAGIELVDDTIPDESTILRFRHLLEAHQLTQAIFAEVRTLLEERACCSSRARSWTPRSSARPVRRRMPRKSATPRCIRPVRASSGISA